jgi:hypothetical protein
MDIRELNFDFMTNCTRLQILPWRYLAEHELCFFFGVMCIGSSVRLVEFAAGL